MIDVNEQTGGDLSFLIQFSKQVLIALDFQCLRSIKSGFFLLMISGFFRSSCNSAATKKKNPPEGWFVNNFQVMNDDQSPNFYYIMWSDSVFLLSARWKC